MANDLRDCLDDAFLYIDDRGNGLCGKHARESASEEGLAVVPGLFERVTQDVAEAFEAEAGFPLECQRCNAIWRSAAEPGPRVR